jgi:DNA-binding NtrC family response regulator
MNQVLVVDDEAGIRTALEANFSRRGWQVETARGASEALARFHCRQPALVVTDIRMPDGDGFAVMRGVRQIAPQTAVILLTAFGNVPDAVAAMRDGACDYLEKPVAFENLERAAHSILGRLHHRSSATAQDSELIGRSPLWVRALERARQAAESDADVLIQAESGTGKELVARMIHRLSARRGRPFVAVNCAAFPEALLESELFGHAKGAFTGAMAAKAGKFELAHGGTLLLDEAGEMPLALQPKLLRALQEREFDRLGDTRSVKVDIRVIATTNRPLEVMVREGSFRADLFYRLNVIPLHLPPLRERREDIPELARHFAVLYAPAGKTVAIRPEFLDRLQLHSWPGNVRELSNLVRRALALSGKEAGAFETGTAQEKDHGMELDLDPQEFCATGEATHSPSPGIFPQALPRLSPQNSPQISAGVSLGEMEKKLLAMTLDATGGNRSRAAEMLGVSLRTVRNKVREYGLPPRRSYVHD